MPEITLEDIIRNNVQLPLHPTALGWYPVLHTACDHGKKGPRAAFKFEGETVVFNCFNCGHAAKYDPSEHPYLSDNMTEVMEDFNIAKSKYQQVVLNALKNHPEKKKDGEEVVVENLEPEEISIPKIFYFLKDAAEDDSWAKLARYYLEEDRNVDPNSYPFMLSHKTKDERLKKWHGRVIIPIYKGNKAIFYVGRDLTGKKMKKYESPSVTRDKVIHGYDILHKDYDKPLYVVEGWFDAEAIDGVAIFGNELNETKIKILNKSRRKKVYIPDRLGDGITAAEQALDAGWAISTPNIGTCKDMSEAVQEYGKLYVLKTLAENTCDDPFTAEVKLRTFCE